MKAIKKRKKRIISPGIVLSEEFLKPYGINKSKLARDIDVPRSRIVEIISGKRSVTADTALRLARYFNTTAQFWLNMQTSYDLAVEMVSSNWQRIEKRIRPAELLS